MKERQTPFEFGSHETPQEHEFKAPESPESPAPKDEEDYDDSPYAERRQQRMQYDQNVARQQANLNKKSPEGSEPMGKVIGHPERFSQSEGLKLRRIAGEAIDQHRRKQLRKKFHGQLGFEKSMEHFRKSVVAQEEEFEEWLKDQK